MWTFYATFCDESIILDLTYCFNIDIFSVAFDKFMCSTASLNAWDYAIN